MRCREGEGPQHDKQVARAISDVPELCIVHMNFQTLRIDMIVRCRRKNTTRCNLDNVL